MSPSIFRIAALGIALGITGQATNAAPVTYNFTGVVNQLNIFINHDWSLNTEAAIAGNHVALGNRVSGFITYDAASIRPLKETGVYELDVRMGYTLSPGGYSFSTEASPGIFMGRYPGTAWVDNEGQFGDNLVLDAHTISVDQGIRVQKYAGLNLVDKTGQMLASDAMPVAINATLQNLLLSSKITGTISVVGRSDFVNFNASITSFERASVSAVPEPSTYLMLLLGLGAVGCAARYRAKSTG